MPHSGKPAELLAAAGIDADGIADAARSSSAPGQRLVARYCRSSSPSASHARARSTFGPLGASADGVELQLGHQPQRAARIRLGQRLLDPFREALRLDGERLHARGEPLVQSAGQTRLSAKTIREHARAPSTSHSMRASALVAAGRA